MLPASVIQAISFFKNRDSDSVDREAVMAYATLKALQHYYADLFTDEMAGLLKKFNRVQVEEAGRIIKQKRIMSYRISQELLGPSVRK